MQDKQNPAGGPDSALEMEGVVSAEVFIPLVGLAVKPLDAALHYVQNGWPVFPCCTDKKPLVQGGFKSATTDQAQVHAWWKKWPMASIGCATGGILGAFVLDVDLPDGPDSLAALEDEHGPLPPTLEQRTGGGGRHLFFKRPEGREVRSSAGKLAPGLDVRGEVGYVILPPSGHPSGNKYAWVSNETPIAEAPGWLLDMVAPLPKPNTAQNSTPLPAHVGATSAYGRKALEDECGIVASTPEGSRNDQLNRSAFALGQLVAGGELDNQEAEAALLGAALSAGLPEHGARKTIASGMAAGEKEPRSAPEQLAAPAKNSENARAGLGNSFSLRDSGVFFMELDKDGNPEWHWVCSPLRILARTRNADGQAWGHLLEVLDPEGGAHRWAMPASLMAGGGDAYRAELLALGLSIAPGFKGKQRLELYLSTAKVDSFARCVERIGWHGEAFVLPDAVYGEQAGELIVAQGLPGENPFRQKGTLEEWKEHVGRFCAGNSRLVLAVCTALAAPLLEPLNQESGGLHFVGGSSLGKTTALCVAGSVCGGGPGGYIKQWRATDNGLESIAAAHCDALLCLDEMGQAGAKVVSEVAYMLANGQGKGRAGREGQARKVHTWRLLFLSTGEVTLADKVAEDGKGRAKAGQAVRVVDIPADAGAGLGLFESLHGSESANLFARQLKEASTNYYGTPLRAFLQSLAADRDTLTRQAQKIMRTFEADNCPEGVDGQVRRVCGRFAMVAATGELGISLRVLPWSTGEASKAAATCFRAWIEQRGGTGAAEVMAGLEQVRRFFQAHGAARFEDMDAQEYRTINNRAGYRRWEKGELRFLVFPEVFQKELCQGYNHKMLAKELIRIGLIEPQFPHHTKKLRNPEGRFYVVSTSILSGDNGGTGDALEP